MYYYAPTLFSEKALQITTFRSWFVIHIWLNHAVGNMLLKLELVLTSRFLDQDRG
jgi:hypothetical protein